MFPFKQTYTTPNYTKNTTNTCEYIVLHHTATGRGSSAGVIKRFCDPTSQVSCHFVVDENGNAYKIGSPNQVLWHAGVSGWGSVTDMNPHSVGIEVIGPLEDGGFTQEQKDTVRKLIQHLMAVFKIPKDRILKHADLTWSGSSQKKYWDWVSPSRKVDIARTFLLPGNSWSEYINTLIPLEI